MVDVCFCSSWTDYSKTDLQSLVDVILHLRYKSSSRLTWGYQTTFLYPNIFYAKKYEIFQVQIFLKATISRFYSCVLSKKKYNKTFLQPPIGPRAFLISADRAFLVDCAVFYAKLHSTGLSGCIKDKLVIMIKTFSTGSRNKFCWNIHVLCLRDRMFRHLLRRCFCSGEFHVPRIAVVGSGPAGFYTAQQILKVRASDTVSVFTSRKSNFQNSVCLEFSMESAYR